MRAYSPQWTTPPPDLLLGVGEIHLWKIHLDVPFASLDSLVALLSLDEKTRADRYRFQRDRHHFVVCRAGLRILLGWYQQREPQHITFGYTEYGKPFLGDQPGGNAFHFNLSHSGGVAVVALSSGHTVGVDIEQVKRDIDIAPLVAMALSPPERTELDAFPAHQQQDVFYAFWTRKEAFVKALGEGLNYPLTEFAVSLTHDRVVLLGESDGSPNVLTVRVTAFDCGIDFAAALAVMTDSWQVKAFLFPQEYSR